jgi:putative flippase GtrA
MLEKLKKYKEQLLYIFFGGCTTLINIAAYYCLTRFAGLNEYASNIIAIILAVLAAYISNKLWVFESRSFSPKILIPEMLKFFGCRAFTMLLDMGILWLGMGVLGIYDLIVKIISNIIVIIVNYIASKFFIFKNPQK